MRRLMAERRVQYPVLGWYVMRHVQRVMGESFDDIAPLNALASHAGTLIDFLHAACAADAVAALDLTA
jgi:hypothetical protein